MYSSRKLLPVLNALLVFGEAARQNNFTRAGHGLGMTQPSVSRFIANLENHLGTQLFERRHKRLRLTESGERLYRAVASGLDEIRQACAEVDAASQTPLLTVECTHGFAHMWLFPRIQSLLDMLPGWKLRTISSADETQLADSETDLVIRLGNGRWDNLESMMLFREQVFPVCSPEFLHRQALDQLPLTAADLSDLPLLFEDFGGKNWMGWSDWFTHFGLEYNYPDDAHPIFNYALTLQAAMEGKGIALAWDQLEEPFLSNDWLVEIPGLRVQTEHGYHLCFSPHCRIADLAREWVEQIGTANESPR